MKKSILIGKLLLLSLAVTAFFGCSSSDDDSLYIKKSNFYVIQDDETSSVKFLPYIGITTNKDLSNVTVTNTDSGIEPEGEIVALRNYETATVFGSNKGYSLGSVAGNYSARLVATNGDVVTKNFTFDRVASELLGAMVVESFEFSVPSYGSGSSYEEWDKFYAVFTDKVTNATEYGLIIIPEGQEEEYYRLDAYRYPVELKQDTETSKWILEVKSNVNSVINRGSGSVDSWQVAVYATDGNGLYKESEFRTLRKGVNSFE